MIYHESAVDRDGLRAYRLGRVREQLVAEGVAAALLFDPINIRYATDVPNMQLWTLHSRVRSAFVAAEGPLVLFELAGAEHLGVVNPLIDEIREAHSTSYLSAGSDVESDTQRWAQEVVALLRACGSGDLRLAVDIADPHMIAELQRCGVRIESGSRIMEHARWIKCDAEIDAMRESLAVCEEGMRRMRVALRPGITENALFAILHATNIELGGEWLETRLLTSGPKTKPWYQECGHRRILAGDLVSFDTDLIGPNGYCADISRSWLCGDVAPTPEQRFIYRTAHEQIEHNIPLMRAGATFREIAEAAYRLPARCASTQYAMIAHGVGLIDEGPVIRHAADLRDTGRDDGVLAPGMVMSVEALVALDDGTESVKLEEMVAITARGPLRLSRYPFEPALLA